MSVLEVFKKNNEIIRDCGFFVTFAKNHVQIHRISPYSKKNITVMFIESGNKIEMVNNAIQSRFRSTVSQLRANAPEYRFVANKQDMQSVMSMLAQASILPLLSDPRPFTINDWYKGGLTKDEQDEVLETMYGRSVEARKKKHGK